MRLARTTCLACLSLLLASCGAAASMTLLPDASARVTLSLEVPEAVDAKVRQFAEAGGAGRPEAPLFDAPAIALSLSARGAAVSESRSPSPRAYRGSYAIKDIGRLLRDDPELSRILRYERGSGWASLSLSVDKGSARALAALFPGLDEDLLESLQPPALYDNPVDEGEYRTMLAGLLGRTATAAIDGLFVTLELSLPGPVLEASGAAEASLGARSARLRVPALSAMTLDRPVAFYLRWNE